MGVKRFWNTLNYSSSNEDGLSELRALEVSPGDRVCAITGGGDRVLHLLLGDPERVCALDVNPAQNHLLELKMAAIRQFDYPAYARFLGLSDAPGRHRLDDYAAIRTRLSPAAAAWFDDHRPMLARGVLYAGRWERFFAMTSRNLRLQRGGKVDRLLSFQTPDEQRAFLHDQWDTAGWRLSLRLAFCRPVCRFAFGDPGFYANVAQSQPPWRYVHARINGYLDHHAARESFMLALVLKGRFFDPVHYPPYLKEEHFATLKARIDRIEIRTASLFDFLATPESAACNKFSLSDVSSFLDEAAYAKLFECFRSRAGARFCLRDFLTRRKPPAGPAFKSIHILDELGRALERDDASIGYSFIIGVVE